MYRLFVAIDPPDELKNQLTEICFGLPGAKWVDPDQMHITLKFIGEVDGAVLRDAREALHGVSFDSFEITVKGQGFFPPRGQPKMIWAGVEANECLTQFRNKVESTLVRAGLKPESRKFTPHIRLANVKMTSPNRLVNYLAQYSLLKLPPFKATEFSLYSSFLATEHAIHEIDTVYPLTDINGGE
jgi:2'-5' RNA ligase